MSFRAEGIGSAVDHQRIPTHAKYIPEVSTCLITELDIDTVTITNDFIS